MSREAQPSQGHRAGHDDCRSSSHTAPTRSSQASKSKRTIWKFNAEILLLPLFMALLLPQRHSSKCPRNGPETARRGGPKVSSIKACISGQANKHSSSYLAHASAICCQTTFVGKTSRLFARFTRSSDAKCVTRQREMVWTR